MQVTSVKTVFSPQYQKLLNSLDKNLRTSSTSSNACRGEKRLVIYQPECRPLLGVGGGGCFLFWCDGGSGRDCLLIALCCAPLVSGHWCWNSSLSSPAFDGHLETFVCWFIGWRNPVLWIFISLYKLIKSQSNTSSYPYQMSLYRITYIKHIYVILFSWVYYF